FRHLFDHQVYGMAATSVADNTETTPLTDRSLPPAELPAGVKSVVVVETPAAQDGDGGSPIEDREAQTEKQESKTEESKAGSGQLEPRASDSRSPNLAELWEQEMRT